jgi:hypothetical protein
MFPALAPARLMKSAELPLYDCAIRVLGHGAGEFRMTAATLGSWFH